MTPPADGSRAAITRSTLAPIPPQRRLRPRERVRLALEILLAYRKARSALCRSAIGEAIVELRGDTPTDLMRGSEKEVLYEALRLGRVVQLTLRFAPGDTRCLTRSLVLTQLLAQRGIEAKLVIGASAKPKFSAHAWVEHAGHPVLPSGDGFPRLVEL